ADAWKLARDVGDVDRRAGSMGTDPEHANWHAMGGQTGDGTGGRKDVDKQSRAEAYDGTAGVVASSDLAGALHAVQDSYYHNGPRPSDWRVFIENGGRGDRQCLLLIGSPSRIPPAAGTPEPSAVVCGYTPAR